jgi:hypothetical protein
MKNKFDLPGIEDSLTESSSPNKPSLWKKIQESIDDKINKDVDEIIEQSKSQTMGERYRHIKEDHHDSLLDKLPDNSVIQSIEQRGDRVLIEFTDGWGVYHQRVFDQGEKISEETETKVTTNIRGDWIKIPKRPAPPTPPPARSITGSPNTGSAERLEAAHLIDTYDKFKHEALKDAKEKYDEAIIANLEIGGINVQLVAHEWGRNPSSFEDCLYVAYKINDEVHRIKYDESALLKYKRPENIPYDEFIENIRDNLATSIANHITMQMVDKSHTQDFTHTNYGPLNPTAWKWRNRE